MRLLTSRLSPTKRSAVRFVIVGNFGTLLQYLLYSMLLQAFGWLWPDAPLVSVAFTLAYVIEVFVNYLLTAYYTFSTKPSRKNASGFVVGRIFNYFIQMVLLHAFAWLYMRNISDELMANKLAGISSILISGIINFFVMHFFFGREKKKNDENSELIYETVQS